MWNWQYGFLKKQLVGGEPDIWAIQTEGEIQTAAGTLKLYENVIDPATVGQCTGLRDKNGTLIFEGDIIRCISRSDMANMVVIFECGEFRMVLCEKYENYITGGGFYAIRCFDKEIIGNIHDNPELLEAALYNNYEESL
jgi:formylmethanofuran dehydrogenase subunit C